jgi:hypothetical protein
MNPAIRLILFCGLAMLPAAARPLIDTRKALEAHDFWENRDFEWFENHIPFFESPDKEIDKTYYYRWELVTRHFVYGNPNTGYAFTEFANRPFWSGAYGTISCPAGHQIYEVRWLHEPRYVRDYLRFWMRHPGAQPRNYSFWVADSAWATHMVWPEDKFITDLLPDLIRNHEGWRKRSWVEDMGLYWQSGHDDGMEFDINALQTRDILRGGQSLRPSFNAYMWADARAIARIAKLRGEAETAAKYEEEAAGVKKRLQEKLWDPERAFFFPMANQDHEKDGHRIKRGTLTYQSGQFAGSPHGRELHGYVPWSFNMPDAGFEDAWQFLTALDFFQAPFGPTTVERKDPLFVLKPGCCWWAGQSWPFATTQTLKAMGNLLQNYSQKHVGRDDYAKLLHTFAISHRKDGKPYIAEALHPDTGSWDGHDMPNRSEHYFHSNFADLVITGLAGIIPSDGDVLTVQPLAPDSWDYFALDRVKYRGHRIAVVWDRTGTRYGLGKGMHVLVNGKVAASSPEIGRLEVKLPAAVVVPVDPNPPINYAVNNDGDFYPRLSASHVGGNSALSFANDGQYRYDIRPSNRWTTTGSNTKTDWIAVDLGTPRTIDKVSIYLLGDAPGEGPVRTPPDHMIEYDRGDGTWMEIPNQERRFERPQGGMINTIRFPAIEAARVKVTFANPPEGGCGLTELELWGPGKYPYQVARPPLGNLAYNSGSEDFPKATASFSDRFGGKPESAIDGKIIYNSTPVNRWTSYGSPNTESDWLEIDFGKAITAGRVLLHVFDDGGGVRAPKDYRVETWNGNAWQPVSNAARKPEIPIGGMPNEVSFTPVETNKLRVVFTHIGQGETRSGLSEIEVWAE